MTTQTEETTMAQDVTWMLGYEDEYTPADERAWVLRTEDADGAARVAVGVGIAEDDVEAALVWAAGIIGARLDWAEDADGWLVAAGPKTPTAGSSPLAHQ
ncbi:MAG: hypothetical protein LC750_07565 [Actinobacteria bacterium]|nr:hypothetical protein [Actinomycetota bacterium]